MKNKLNGFFSNNREALQTKTAKVGGYSFVLTVIVLAILIAVNVLFSTLPSNLTQFDISAAQLYSVTSSTKVVVNNLQDDVTIYWICQAGQEDTVIEKLLNVYDSMNSHLTVERKDPDVYPTFAAQYTDETVANNSLIVVSGDVSRYIAYNDIYEQEIDYYTYTSKATGFDGEGLITSAINYVTSEDHPKVYVLTGHGEQEISDAYTTAITRANMETEEFSLLNIDEIPEDCSAILINGPTSDISEDELTMLRDYLAGGGKLMVFSGPAQDSELTNLKTLLTDYNISANDGVLIEADRDHYASSAPYVLLPTIESSDITDELAAKKSNIIIPIAQGLTIGTAADGVTITSLLDSTEESFVKAAGYSLTTYDFEDGDTQGSFSVGLSIEDESTNAQIIWVSTDYMIDDSYNSYSSGANIDFVMNSTYWLVGDTDSISIASKSLEYNYLTISSSMATRLKICMIGIIPAAFLLFGILEVVERRRLN